MGHAAKYVYSKNNYRGLSKNFQYKGAVSWTVYTPKVSGPLAYLVFTLFQ